ncbi:MAG: zinc-ribbon domain-containing protein [Tissierellia bacterium]|nr:zinc-ribbon domain-containing protein [Tissierellia bacterium]
MFCPKCGEKLLDQANFCHHCGNKVDFVTKKTDTKDFQPIKEEEPVLDGPKSIEKTMETTSDLVEIIEEVDRKINEEITKHDKQKTEDDPNFIGPKMDDTGKVKPRRNTQPFTPIKEVPLLKDKKQKTTEKTVQFKKPIIDTYKKNKDNKDGNKKEAISNHPFDQKPVKRPATFDDPFILPKEKKPIQKDKVESKPKESSIEDGIKIKEHQEKPKTENRFKKMWKNFINEDDDQYSIFSAMKQKKEEPKAEIKNDILRQDQSHPVETLESQVVDESIDFTSDSKVLRDILEEQKEMVEEKEGKKAKSSFTPFKKRKHWKKDDVKKIPMKPLTEEEIKEPVKKEKKDFSAQLTPLSQSKVEQKSEKEKKKFSLKNDYNTSAKDNTLKKEDRKKDKEKKKKRFIESDSSKDNKISSLRKLFNRPVTHIYKEQKQSLLLYFIIALLFTTLPPIITIKKLTSFLPILIFIKVLLSYFTFRMAINIGDKQVGLGLSSQNKNLSAMVNWAICSILTFITFMIHGFITDFTLITAMTPTLWTTILLYIMTTILAYVFHYESIQSTDRIHFIGWYSTGFIIFELICKLIWFIINFFTTIF